MTLLAQLGGELPERYYLGLDIGYKEHVATVNSLETFVCGGEKWKIQCQQYGKNALNRLWKKMNRLPLTPV